MFRSEARDGKLESTIQWAMGRASPLGVFIVLVPGLELKSDNWVAMQLLSKDAMYHLKAKVLFHKHCAPAMSVPVCFFT